MIRPGVYRLGENVEISGVFYNSVGDIMHDVADVKVFLRNPENELLGPFAIPFIDGEAFMDFELNKSPLSIGEWRVRLECGYPQAAIVEDKFLVVPFK